MSFLRFLLASLIMLMPCFNASAQTKDEKPDPIDTEVSQMMDKNPSTQGMMEAIRHGTDLWDAQMNLAYNQLIKKLPASERPVLQKSQRAWLAYRDSHSDLVTTVYGHAEGTMYQPMACDELLEVVKARTLQLRKYLDLLDENSQ